MLAAQLSDYGPAENLKIVELADPSPGPEDVLVKVHAASINPIDCKIRSGAQRMLIHYRLPWTLGLDVAGEVLEVGAKVTRFKVGDAIYASLDYQRPGAYAEKLVVHESLPALKPESLSFQEAAAVPLAALTVWQSLVTTAQMKAGDKVFIQAGAGGVGHIAIQIAKAFGATVATTCSDRNIAFVKELGADVPIDYKKQDYNEILTDYDIVLDSLGGDHRAKARKCLKPGGRIVSLVSDIPKQVKEKGTVLGTVSALLGVGGFLICSSVKGIKASMVIQRPNAEHLQEVTKLIDDQKLRIVIDSSFSLQDIVEAHKRSESGRARGKIIVDMQNT